MFKTGDYNLPQLLVRLTCLFWVITKLLCFKVWHSDRLFPVTPAFVCLDNVPNIIHLGLFSAAILGMTLLIFFPINRYLLAITLLVELSSCLLDLNRIQPWEYQYFLTLLFAYFYRNKPSQFLNYLGFLLAVTYINSGLHKCSGGFLYHAWDKIVLHNLAGFSAETIRIEWVHYLGLSLGLIEAGAGAGLLFLRHKKACARLLIAMHLLILLFISPTGINYNFIIWPWNIMMIVLLALLFLKPDTNILSVRNLVKVPDLPFFVLIGVMPLFCFIGYFDNFLSFNLYSGTSKNLEICLQDQETINKYRHFLTNTRTFCKDAKTIDVTIWSLQELQVPVYPEERVYLDIISKFKAANPDAGATFNVYQYPYHTEAIRQYE